MMEKPKIRRIALAERNLSIGNPCFLIYGATQWGCYGRGVEGYGLDPDQAYRRWRRRLAEKKRQGIASVRHKKLQERMIGEGYAYRKPDGTFRWRPISAPVRKTMPVRELGFWGKVFGK